METPSLEPVVSQGGISPCSTGRKNVTLALDSPKATTKMAFTPNFKTESAKGKGKANLKGVVECGDYEEQVWHDFYDALPGDVKEGCAVSGGQAQDGGSN